MTIKTQDGKIITKDGKVSCDCCGACGCVNVAGIMIGTQLLSDILDNATTGTANGYPPNLWGPNPSATSGWYGQWYPVGQGVDFACEAFYNADTKVLCVNSDNGINAVDIGAKENCDYCTNGQYAVICSDTTQSVNTHIFDATYAEFSSNFPFTAPSLVFS